MKITTAILLMFILLVSTRGYAHENHDNHEVIDIETLPFITITIINDTDSFLSLTIGNLCEPRVILKPSETITTDVCFRHGLIYHTRAVFYNQNEILETRDFLFLAKPQTPWVFFKNTNGQSQ